MIDVFFFVDSLVAGVRRRIPVRLDRFVKVDSVADLVDMQVFGCFVEPRMGDVAVYGLVCDGSRLSRLLRSWFMESVVLLSCAFAD